jgi:predicted Fe-Mo cluster-binding NifX family protein
MWSSQGQNMKIIITASSDKIEGLFNPRFGRADYFMLYDNDSQEWSALQNPAVNASGGAGPQAVQFIAGNNPDVVISGRYGPSAYTALEAAGIKTYIANTGTVKEVLGQFLDDQLNQVAAATGPSMHGRGR